MGKMDVTAMSNYLSNIDWLYLLSVNLSSDALWSAFCGVINNAVDMFVPARVFTDHAPKWRGVKLYPSHIKKTITCKRGIWRCLHTHLLNPVLLETYNYTLNKCQRSICNYKIKKDQEVISKNNIGSFL
jgi:hypothetical protein